MREFKISISRKAKRDLSQAIAYYEGVNKDLGKRFGKVAADTIDSLKVSPHTFRIRFDDFRAVSVKGFPYLIVYRIKEEVVQIIRIWHMSRNPDDLIA